MSKMKNIWAISQKDDDLRRCIVSELEATISGLMEFIDCDDVVGNRLMAYCIANVDEIADTFK